ncbi:MAG: phosphotransferase [Alphaproteobacteria bacterium]|nr:phosphotransferase [Alphaproteobacteria bacterium]
MASRRILDPKAFGREARDACWQLLGRKAVDVDWPASRSRRSVRVEFEDGSVIATRRKRPERSQLEAVVMKTLHDNGGAVPAILAYDGAWLLQEYIEGERLPHVFAAADAGRSRAALVTAAQELAKIHRIAADTGLDQKVVRLGVKETWVAQLIDTPTRIGEAIAVPAPLLDNAAISQLIEAGAPSLVKWDARPGNAMMRTDGSVVWFDWEHCGARNALDDFAWLLADEYVPEIDGLADIAIGHIELDLLRSLAVC